MDRKQYNPLEKFQMVDTANEGKLVYNFSPGPCILPRAVLDKAQESIVDYKGTGQSVMEMSHRSPAFINISEGGKDEIRKFLEVPDTHTIMFNQGGATSVYTAAVKNLLGLKPAKKAMYVTTGLWSEQCIAEARKHIPPENLIEVTNTKGSNYTQLTDPRTWKVDNEASYLHVCVNETVHGFEINEDNFPWSAFPDDMVVVGDMSSNIGSCKVNWKRYDVVYAGVQKNLGPTGATVIICRKDLLGKALSDVPILNDWATFEKSPGTYYNTPPVWCIYVTALNISYMNQLGGIEFFDRMADVKSQMVYAVIDKSNGYYVNKTATKFRSRMNINFRIEGNRSLEAKLMEEAAKVKVVNIKGHFTNPGIRISIYNAMPVQGVITLCKLLDDFRKANPCDILARM